MRWWTSVLLLGMLDLKRRYTKELLSQNSSKVLKYPISIVYANIVGDFSTLYIPIADVGDVYISNSCKAPKEELKQLILSGGGSVAKVTRIASVVVGETRPDCDNADFVTEKWVLDSVQYHVVMPFSDYPM